MVLVIVSFLSGILSVLAPCVLPVLPVIFSGSLSGEHGSKTWRIIVAMMISIVAFTFLLKVSTLFISIDPSFWTTVSSVIIIVYGLLLLFPEIWDRVSLWLRLDRVNTLTEKASSTGGWRGDVLLGMSLGPLFSTCSPTYALLFSTVLPVSLTLGLICMIVYAFGFGGFLWVLVKGGRSLIKRFYGVSDSHGLLKRFLGLVLVVTGMLIFTGYIKKLETTFLDYIPDVSKVEQYLIKTMGVVNSIKKQDQQITPPTRGEDDKNPSDLLNAEYVAPDIIGLTGWINSSGYQSLSELKGKVVLVDFWTYSCINCIRTLPYLQKWHEKYAQDGLVVLGIHAPEFAFEKVFENVLQATQEFGLTYPVAQDNDFATWNQYENHYWPAKYIIDRNGMVRYTHFGEGNYDSTEKVIQELLGMSGSAVMVEDLSDLMNEMDEVITSTKSLSLPITSETYLGTQRRGKNVIWSLEGDRQDGPENISLQSSPGTLRIQFQAKEINLVLDGPKDRAPVQVMVVEEGNTINTFTVDDSRLYNIATYPEVGPHTIDIMFQGSGVNAYAFTFG